MWLLSSLIALSKIHVHRQIDLPAPAHCKPLDGRTDQTVLTLPVAAPVNQAHLHMGDFGALNVSILFEFQLLSVLRRAHQDVTVNPLGAVPIHTTANKTVLRRESTLNQRVAHRVGAHKKRINSDDKPP